MNWSETHWQSINSARKAAEYLRCVGSNGAADAARRHEELKAMSLDEFIEDTRKEWIRLGMEPPPNIFGDSGGLT